MRRTPLALTSVALAAVLALAGCSGGGAGSAPSSDTGTAEEAAGTDAPPGGVGGLGGVEGTADPSAPAPSDCSTLTIDSDSDALPKVSGGAGAEPTLTWGGDEAPANLTVKTLSEGQGETVAAEDLVAVAYAGWQWDSDKAFDSSYSRGVPAQFSLSGVISGWRCGLPGHRVGDRLEMAIPADQAYGDNPAEGKPSGPLVFVVEIRYAGTFEEMTAGTADAVPEGEQSVADRGVSVTGELGSEPSITVGSGAAEPTETEVIVLARGAGEPITKDSTLLVNVAFSSWDNSKPGSSWADRQPQLVPMSSATGLAGLVGVPVGSRVVVLVPAAKDQTGRSLPAFAHVMDIEAAV